MSYKSYKGYMGYNGCVSGDGHSSFDSCNSFNLVIN